LKQQTYRKKQPFPSELFERNKEDSD